MDLQDIHVLISGTLRIGYLTWQKGLCRYAYVKNLEMGRLSSIIWVGPRDLLHRDLCKRTVVEG